MSESIDIKQYKIMFNHFCFSGEIHKLIYVFNNMDTNLVFSDTKFIDDCFSSATFTGKFNIIQQLYTWLPDYNNDNFSKLLIYACENDNSNILDLIISKNPNKTISQMDFEDCILGAIRSGNLDIIKKIIDFYSNHNDDDDIIDLSFADDQPLKIACEFGYFDIVLYLLDNFPNIIISHYYEEPFVFACQSGNFELVKLLFLREPNINISVENNFIIKYIIREELYFESNHKDIILFLVQKKPDIMDSIRLPNEIIEFFNLHGFQFNKHWLDIFINVDDQSNPFQCNICYQNIFDYYVKTPCNHEFCRSCIHQWVEINNICPFCRTSF